MEALWHKVEMTSEFKRSDVILLYWSLPDEVDTHEFIARWYGRKRIVLPKVSGDDLLLFEYDPARMAKGAFGILEPTADAVPVDPSAIQLAIVPGRLFDLGGGRKGRGKGYYDRFLPKLHCPFFGVAFPSQIVDKLELEPHDVPMDEIIY